ncbi:epoxyqueuosine reductase [Clostridium sp. FP1]|uniref:epoxyqueuosine reductase n=1 Tax=Clostridium sp. FP1 TaxID=2724076 RepID=UPI0013E97226|nr:epoxyqueuosine reductase [Clostridium sp. FP1]MBZ9635012.1 epoxyqueuosine reductase [Clostridium sp. FP1]
MEDISFRIKNELLNKGASLVGFGDLKDIPSHKRSDMRYGISIAVALNPSIINKIKNGPTQEYYEEYKRVNTHLDGLVEYAGKLLKDFGYNAILKTTSEVVLESNSYSTILPHKTVATRAGLGWIGKSALLVTEEFGSAIRISSLLTNAPLNVGIPINESRCGECCICKLACPAKAPLGENWNVNKQRGSFFNAFECHSLAKERAAMVGIDATICGKCIVVCPWTRGYLKKHGFM